MNTRTRAVAGATGGVITRSQLLDCGLTPTRIANLVRADELVILRRGVYCLGETWRRADEHVEQPRLMARAAAATMHRAWVLSHDSAAHEQGLDILRPSRPHVHVTRPGYSSAWSRAGVKHHYARFMPSQVRVVDDVRVLDVARTVADIGREHGELHAMVATDSALRLGVSKSAIWAAIAQMEFWPGIVATRSGVDRGRRGAESVAESLGRDLVEELGAGDIDLQFPVQVENGRVYWCDMRVGNHVFEVDGRIKFRAREHGGVADRAVEELMWDERTRAGLVCAEGLGLSRIRWDDFWGDGRRRALARLTREYAISRDRFGETVAPHLAERAQRVRSHGVRPRSA